jgi:hypothetical protein
MLDPLLLCIKQKCESGSGVGSGAESGSVSISTNIELNITFLKIKFQYTVQTNENYDTYDKYDKCKTWGRIWIRIGIKKEALIRIQIGINKLASSPFISLGGITETKLKFNWQKNTI